MMQTKSAVVILMGLVVCLSMAPIFSKAQDNGNNDIVDQVIRHEREELNRDAEIFREFYDNLIKEKVKFGVWQESAAFAMGSHLVKSIEHMRRTIIRMAMDCSDASIDREKIFNILYEAHFAAYEKADDKLVEMRKLSQEQWFTTHFKKVEEMLVNRMEQYAKYHHRA